MSELPSPIATTPGAAEAPPQFTLQTTEAAPDSFMQQGPGWVRVAVLVLSVAAAGAGWLAWQTQKRVQNLEQELVRRQQDSQGQATEARVAARQAQELAREAAARVTLLDARLGEVALQRSQIEELIKSLNVSRDENLVYDLEAGLRVASQQAALTGGAEPLIAALQAADERLTRSRQPRLDNVRRAVAKDLDRARATRVADINALSIRLDEAVRLVDDIPLINQPEATLKQAPPATQQPATASASGATKLPKGAVSPNGKAVRISTATGVNTSADTSAGDDLNSWRTMALAWGRDAAQSVWSETRSLVRVTRIAQPEGMLIAPDQAFFLRENVKLRLLNARLALLSRQTAQATSDLRLVENTLPRYFDVQSRKTQLLQSMVSDVVAQSQQTAVPRPDDTLAALAAVSGGR